ncbi:MAG TPA: guanylate kinase [Planctomycetes bacterium]|nr:guanylate kinase [Planctomycetota bacterium]
MGGEGLLVVISGPSGVGKNTIAELLVARGAAVRLTTATTRSPKPGEVPGQDYHFFTEEEFRRRIDSGYFLEYARVFDSLYGTPLDDVRLNLGRGKTILLLIDVQGARLVRKAGLPALHVFIAPPDAAALRERLRGRGRESEKELAGRLGEAERELAARHEYDHVVVNDTPERAAGAIAALIAARRGAAAPASP